MPEAELAWLTLSEVADRLQSTALSPVEVTRALLERIERLQPRLHPYATVLAESALCDAERAASELARGQVRGPLHGVPLAVKDLCATKGVRTACGTTVLGDRVPDHDASVVTRLRDAGAVLLGKLQLTEGAMATHHPDITPPVNPWSAEHWPGVSSSGSGVATAAALCFASLGSDTGGSIRFPSACNAVVGIKPTYGRVSRHGVFPLSDSLDHVGPMTRRVRDAALLLGVIAGFDPLDPTSRREPVPDYTADLETSVRGIRLGLDEAYVTQDTDPRVAESVLAATEVLRGLGAEIRRVTVPPVDRLLEGWNTFVAPEAARAHRDTFPSRADAYGPPFRRFLERGLAIPATEYAAVQAEREAFRGRLASVFDEVDLIVCPSTPFPPLPLALIEQLASEETEGTPVILRFTAPFDFSGSPTLSLPCGFTEDGLPLSLQLVGRPLEEALLCRAGYAYEQATEWHARRPPL